jgi:Tol biopolymer transport system component
MLSVIGYGIRFAWGTHAAERRWLRRCIAVLAAVALVVAGMFASPASAADPVTERVSVSSAGAQSNGTSTTAAISADGRYVAFASDARNLVDPADTNNVQDVFVRDRSTGETSRVSVSSAGVPAADGFVNDVAISGDGRYVAFVSTASNLFPGDTFASIDVFVHDRVLGTTERVAPNSLEVDISGDGRFVAFLGPVGGVGQVLVRDRLTGSTAVASILPNGSPSTNGAHQASISADGRYVAFIASTPLQVYVRDMQLGQTVRASVASDGTAGNQTSTHPSVSNDGRFVAFSSGATNLVPGDTNTVGDIFVHDTVSGETNRISVSSAGTQSNNVIDHDGLPSISADGRFVTFSSAASNLVVGDTNASVDVFLHDRQTHETSRISVSSTGAQANSFSASPQISADGRYVAFSSRGTALVAGDTNSREDIFVRQLAVAPTDTSPPDISYTLTSAEGDGDDGWLHSDVHLVWAVADGQSPVQTVGCVDQSITADQPKTEYSCTATSAGGTTGPVTVTIGRDSTPPEVSYTLTPAAGAGDDGWHHGDVHLVWTVTDDLSPVQTSGCVDQSITADQPKTDYPCSATSAGGTTGPVTVTIGRDTAPPGVSHTLTPASPDGANGWYRSDVDLVWTVADDLSPVQTSGCVDQSITADQPKTGYSCTATSAGGTTGPVTVTIGRDATAPDVHTTVLPSTPDGDNGWYLAPVALAYSCTDATSGMASCPQNTTVGEGAAQVVPATGTDRAGNTRTVTSGPYDVDLTDPTVTCQSEPAFVLGQTGHVSATVTDTGSGPAAPLVTAAADTSSVGSGGATVTGADVAGRTATGECGYRVHYGFTGFQAPVDNGVVNVAKAGTAIPLKWRLTDHSGNPVLDLTSVRITSAGHTCDGGAPEDAIEEVASGASGLQNLGGGNYQINWKSPKNYAGTCRTLHLDFDEGLTHNAEFRFKA